VPSALHRPGGAAVQREIGLLSRRRTPELLLWRDGLPWPACHPPPGLGRGRQFAASRVRTPGALAARAVLVRLREIHTLLNRSESVHQLQRVIHGGQVAPERGRRRQEMTAISGSHALLTNIVLAWNTNRMDVVARIKTASGSRRTGCGESGRRTSRASTFGGRSSSMSRDMRTCWSSAPPARRLPSRANEACPAPGRHQDRRRGLECRKRYVELTVSWDRPVAGHPPKGDPSALRKAVTRARKTVGLPVRRREDLQQTSHPGPGDIANYASSRNAVLKNLTASEKAASAASGSKRGPSSRMKACSAGYSVRSKEMLLARSAVSTAARPASGM
jgi:hypothetical protein